MKTFFLMMLLISFSVVAGTDPAKVCGEDAVSSRLLKDWKKNDKDRYCVEAECSFKDKNLKREKCFFQNGEVGANVVFVSTSDHASGSYRSRADKVFLNGEEKCTDACMEGVKKKSCQECFKTRALEYKEEEFINYPEIGKPIRKGTKCYSACMDKAGPIQKTRVLTPECSSCVGVNGFTAEKFEYIQTKTGVCVQLDSQRKVYIVDRILCKEAGKDLSLTTYRSSKSAAQWFFNQPPGCFEVDELTYGHIVKIEVDADRCGQPSVNDSDRNLIKEDKPKSKSKTGSTSSSSKQ